MDGTGDGGGDSGGCDGGGGGEEEVRVKGKKVRKKGMKYK